MSVTGKEFLEVAWLEINTPDGNFVIQAEFIETTFVLSPQKHLIYCLKTGKEESLILERGGILEITPTQATVIIG